MGEHEELGNEIERLRKEKKDILFASEYDRAQLLTLSADLNLLRDERDRLRAEVARLKAENVDNYNRLQHILLLLGLPEDASTGAIRDAMRKKWCRRFAVTDGENEGWCYAWLTHFDVHFGRCILDTPELSLHGIRKIRNSEEE